MKPDFTARVMSAAQILKANGYEDVAQFLVASELAQRKTKRTGRKRKTILYTARGEKIELWRDVIKQLEHE